MNLLLRRLRSFGSEIAALAALYLALQDRLWPLSALVLAAMLILRSGRTAPARSRRSGATGIGRSRARRATGPNREGRAKEHPDFFELPEERRCWIHPVERTQVDTRVYRGQGRTFRLDRYVDRDGYPYTLYEVAETRTLVPIPVSGALEWGANTCWVEAEKGAAWTIRQAGHPAS